MTKIINVLKIPEHRRGSERYKWYERLVSFDGKPIEEFMKSVPSAKDASDWMRFFERNGVLKLTSSAEYAKHVHLYTDDPYGTIKGLAWFLWCVGKWLFLTGVVLGIGFFIAMKGFPVFAVIIGIVALFIVLVGSISDLGKRSEKMDKKYYMKN